jgi:hypothetical protein
MFRRPACGVARRFHSEAFPRLEPVKTGAEWRAAGSKPRDVDPNATMPNFQLTEREIEELCITCSAEVPEELTRRVQAAGGELPETPMAALRRVALHRHTVEGMQGRRPMLKVASAASRGWLLAYVRDPHAFNPAHPCPGTTSPMPNRATSWRTWRRIPRLRRTQGDSSPPRESHARGGGREDVPSIDCPVTAFRGAAGGEVRSGPRRDGDKGRPSSTSTAHRPAPGAPAWLVARSRRRVPREGTEDASGEPEQARAVTALLGFGSQAFSRPIASYRPACPRPFRPGASGGSSTATAVSRAIRSRQGRRHLDGSLTFRGQPGPAGLAHRLSRPLLQHPADLTERMPSSACRARKRPELADAIETLFVDPRVPEDPFLGHLSSDSDAVEGERLYVGLRPRVPSPGRQAATGHRSRIGRAVGRASPTRGSGTPVPARGRALPGLRLDRSGRAD